MKTADIDSGAHSRSTSVVECVKGKLCTTILLAMLGLTSAVVSATEITDPIAPDIYQLTEAEKQAYLVPLIASDSGFLFDTGSADPSMYYNAGAYASTTVMGWVGMSTPATYAVYYGLEWVGFLISEILERTGDHRAAQYFPHSNKFDIDLSCDTAQSSGNFLVDAQNNFTTSFCDGDSGVVVLEVIADASASLGYSTYESMYNSLTLMSSTMLYTNSLLDTNNLEGTVNNVLNTLGMPNGGTSGNVPPYYFYTGVGPESTYLYVANRSHSSISASITQKMFSFGPTIYLDFPNIETGFTSDIIQQGTIAWAGGGDDTIVDVITAFGGAGNDTILGSTTANGENGNDILVGNRYNYGGDGDDVIMGGSLNQEFHSGGNGDDIIQGNTGSDQIYGGTGRDVISEIIESNHYNHIDGGSQVSSIEIENDSLKLVLKEALDYFIVTDQNSLSSTRNLETFDFALFADGFTVSPLATVINIETLIIQDEMPDNFNNQPPELNFSGLTIDIYHQGNAQNSIVTGGEGNDLLRGEGGQDSLSGGEGNDVLDGGDGSDNLRGGGGHDLLFPSGGRDIVDGGEGVDTISYTNSTTQINARLDLDEVGKQYISGDYYQYTDKVRNVENLIGSPFDDQITGNSGDNLLVGGDGDDVIVGGAGDDTLIGGSGVNTLTGGEGNDTFVLTVGASTYITDYNAAEDTIQLDTHAMINIGWDDYYIADNLEGLQYVSRGLGGWEIGLRNSSGMGKTLLDLHLQNGEYFNISSQLTFLNRNPDLLYKTQSNEPKELSIPLLTSKQANSLNHEWTAKNISGGPFVNPAVFTSAPTKNGSDGGAIRLANIDSAGFDISFKEWNYLDGTHTTESYDYLVMDHGVYSMADGSVIEVGSFTLDDTGVFLEIDFTEQFSSAPYLFLSIQTFNGSDTVSIRAKNITNTGFKAALYEQESLMATYHNVESISYIAIDPASGSHGVFNSDQGGKNFELYRETVSSNGALIGSHYYTIEEESSRDSETAHTSETVNVLEINGVALIQQVSSNGGDTVSIRRQ